MKTWPAVALCLSLLAGARAEDAPSASSRVLAKAQELADKKAPYGTGEGELVCTTFVVEVLEHVLGAKLTSEMKDQINIRGVEANDESRKAAVEAKKAEIGGVQHALVQAGLGTAVQLKDLAPGDLVQYWYLKDEKWEGHAGVVKSVSRTSATFADIQLLGAHKSKGKSGEIGVQLDLKSKKETKVFAVRLKD